MGILKIKVNNTNNPTDDWKTVQINTETISGLASLTDRVETIAAAAATADDKAVAAQEAINTLAGKVGTVTGGKTVVEMIAEAQTAATYNDTEVKSLINTNATNISNEIARATKAEKDLQTAINKIIIYDGQVTEEEE